MHLINKKDRTKIKFISISKACHEESPVLKAEEFLAKNIIKVIAEASHRSSNDKL